MTSVGGINGANSASYVNETQTSGSSDVKNNNTPDVPNHTSTVKAGDVPTLPAPLGGLSLETLMKALGNETRRSSVQKALQDVSRQGDEIRTEGEKRLEEIKKQIDASKSQSFWQKFCKAFEIIGAIVGAVASVSAIMTGNPVLIAAGIMGIISSVNSITSAASDGKYNMASGIAWIAKQCGASEETAKWIGFGFSMAFTVASVATSTCGAIKFAKNAAKIATTVLKQFSNRLAVVSSLASSAVGVGTAAGSIGLAVANYKYGKAEAAKKEIEAVLEQLRQSLSMNQELIQKEMERSQKLVNDVKEIVDDCAKTSTSILTTTPATA